MNESTESGASPAAEELGSPGIHLPIDLHVYWGNRPQDALSGAQVIKELLSHFFNAQREARAAFARHFSASERLSKWLRCTGSGAWRALKTQLATDATKHPGQCAWSESSNESTTAD
jgi:hypothetical protein